MLPVHNLRRPVATSRPRALDLSAAAVDEGGLSDGDVDEGIYDDVNDIICAIIDDRRSPIYVQCVFLAIQLLLDFVCVR